MKPSPMFLIFVTALLLKGCATRPIVALQTPTIVEAACGECKFGLKGDDCDLAIRVDGHSYFVDGICEAIRQARVTGEVKDGRFVATSFVLLPGASR